MGKGDVLPRVQVALVLRGGRTIGGIINSCVRGNREARRDRSVVLAGLEGQFRRIGIAQERVIAVLRARGGRFVIKKPSRPMLRP